MNNQFNQFLRMNLANKVNRDVATVWLLGMNNLYMLYLYNVVDKRIIPWQPSVGLRDGIYEGLAFKQRLE